MKGPRLFAVVAVAVSVAVLLAPIPHAVVSSDAPVSLSDVDANRSQPLLDAMVDNKGQLPSAPIATRAHAPVAIHLERHSVRAVTAPYDDVSGLDLRRNYGAVHEEWAPLAKELFASAAPGVPATRFETRYAKLNCGALVANMCLWNGQPRYFRSGKALFTSKGGTLSCNEAGAKQRFHMVVYDQARVVSRERDAVGVDTGVPSVGVVPYDARTVLIVPYCWELYGYHLVLCIQATFAQMQRLSVHQLPYSDLRVAFMRGGSFTPYCAGSNSSWTVDRRPPGHDDVHPSPYWPLWKAVVPFAYSVDPLPQSPMRCYPLAIVAGLPSNEVTPTIAVAWRGEVMQRLGLRRSAPINPCMAKKSYRTVIVQRKSRFMIRDIDRVKQAVESVIGADVSVVSLEGMPFDQQVQLSIDADLWVGLHGNGLTWVTMMQNGSALLELWPSAPYNANYYHLATRANVRIFSYSGDGNCAQRCSANFAGSTLTSRLVEIRAHLDEVHCHRRAFDPSAEYMRERATLKAKKAAKRRAAAREP